MEDHRTNLAVTVAGFPEQMEHFIQSDSEMRSQFRHRFYFEDYTPSQLTEILLQCFKEADYFLDESAKELAAKYIERLYEDRGKLFGNAREMRDLRDFLVAKQAYRLIRLGEPSAEELKQITTQI